jgi:NitT/TauT family transport system substrate-binding protein
MTVILALAVVALAAYGVVRQWRSSAAPEMRTLRRITVAQFGDFFLYAPLYVAIDGGFARRRGLDVSIVNTGGDDKTWAAVLSGSAHFGVADPTFVAVSAARGEGGVVVASVVNGVPFWGITYKDLAPFKTAGDLAGHSVATFPSPSTAYALQQKMFADAGLPPNIREGAFGAIIPMLKAGTADIGLELEPNVSEAVRDGARIVYSMAEHYGAFAITGLTTRELTVRSDPTLVQDLRSAIQEALDLLHADRAASASILARRFPALAPRIADAALERALRAGVVPQSIDVTEEAWKKAVDLRMSVGDLSAPAPFDRFVWSPERVVK